MSIPVRVNPSVKAHVARAGVYVAPEHPLADELCPVCDEPLVEAPISLVYVGRYPDEPTGWTAAAVAVHDTCTAAAQRIRRVVTTPTPRWTPETEELVMRFTWHASTGPDHDCDGCRNWSQRVLTALADAGVLTPVGGETRQEWCARTSGLQYPDLDESTVWLKYGELRSRGYTAEVVTRTITTWADGTELIRPWREVTDDPA